MLQPMLDDLGSMEILTTASIDRLLQKLAEEKKQIEDEVHLWVLRILEESVDDQKMMALEEALTLMEDDSESNSRDSKELKRLLTEYRNQMDSIREVENELDSIRFQRDLREQLSKLNTMKERGKHSDAAWCLLELQQRVNDRKAPLHQKEEQKTAEAAILKTVEQTDRDVRKRMHAFIFEETLSLDTTEQRLSIRSASREQRDVLNEMWKASEILEQTEAIMVVISEKTVTLINDVILQQEFETTELVFDQEDTEGVQMWGWKNVDGSGAGEAVKSRLAALGSLVKFLNASIFTGLSSLVECLGYTVWSQIHPLLSGKALAAAEKMEENDKLAYLETLFKESSFLEETLKSIGFLESDDSSLSSHISAVSKAEFHTFSERYVTKARGLIKKANWDAIRIGTDPAMDEKWIQQQMRHAPGTQTGSSFSNGIDLLQSPLGRGAYKITETALELHTIINSVAREACNRGRLVLQALLQGIRDICSMYNCLFPVLYRKEMDIPQLGLLTANDFFYLSSEMLLLPFKVPKLKAMDSEISFHFQAEKLYRTGQQILKQQVSKQGMALKEVLNQAADFGYLRTGQEGIVMRRVTNQLTRLLGQLGRVLQEVLSVSDRCLVAVAITETMVEPILAKLMTRTEVLQQEKQELTRVIQSLLDEIPTAMLKISPKLLGSIDNGNALNNIDAAVREQEMRDWLLYYNFSKSCHKMKQLKKLLKFWEADLDQIVNWWISGELIEDGFTLEDTRTLIWALFEHSDKRENTIATISHV